MKCVLSGTNARVFAKAVQSLSRIGSDLFIEATPEGLSMRTVNNSKSAFALFRFFTSFFDEYDLNANSQDEFENKCKVSMKAYLGVFKNMKQVEHCKIIIDSKNSKLVVQLKCRLETLKTHSISIIDVETLQAVYVTDNVPNKISASNKLFGEISSNFQMNEEEITLETGSDNLIVKNYVEGSHVDRRFMRSQFNLKSNEFDKYSVKEETSITFCLREFRAILSFAEAINLDMLLHFETTGKPVVFIVNNLQRFEANLVMSSLSPDATICESNLPQNNSFNNTSNINLVHKRSNTNREEPIIAKKTKLGEAQTSTNDEQPEFNFSTRTNLNSIETVRGKANSEGTNVIAVSSKVYDKTNPIRSDGDYNTNEELSGICVTFENTGDTNKNNDECIVPKSPTYERKLRTRKIFKRCFEATFNSRKEETTQILARNSDTED